MPYVKTINEDGVVSDIMAKALDPDVLVNGFTQTTAGVNALDAAAGKTLNDSLANCIGALSSASFEVYQSTGTCRIKFTFTDTDFVLIFFRTTGITYERHTDGTVVTTKSVKFT